MPSPCSVVLMLALITIVTGQASDARRASELEALKRYSDGSNNAYMQNNGNIPHIVEDPAMKQQENAVHFMLKDPSAAGGSVNISVSLPSKSAVCLKVSAGRGVGEIPTTQCNTNEEQYGALCYPKCSDGYESVGCCLCRKKGCPPQFTDDGVATCIKPESYGRGVGYAWNFGDGFDISEMFRRCEADNGAGNCEQSGAIVYPKCRSGFHAQGCCICSPSCPNGMNDIGISCGKLTYGRGAGVSRLKCADDKEKDAGLCYTKCTNDWYGVGPVCWQNCPSSTPYNCGSMCTVDEFTCVQTTLSIIAAAAQAGLSIALGNIAQGIVEGALAVIDVMSNPFC